MKYQVYSEEQIGLRNLLAEGDGTFEVLEAEDKVSQEKKHPMIKMRIRVWDAFAASADVFNYLVATENAAFKIHEFCAATGLDYSRGELDVNLIKGKKGKCILFTEKGTGKYPDKTAIKSYVAIDDPTAMTAELAEAFEDDPIPF